MKLIFWWRRRHRWHRIELGLVWGAVWIQKRRRDLEAKRPPVT